MRHVAVIGSGPAGYYTAEALAKQFGDQVQVDILDCLPTPYGLIRAGVAPDHQSIKAVYKRYEGTSLSGNVRDAVLANAPDAQHGFFAVPKVIE